MLLVNWFEEEVGDSLDSAGESNLAAVLGGGGVELNYVFGNAVGKGVKPVIIAC